MTSAGGLAPDGGRDDPVLALLRRYVPGRAGVFAVAVAATVLHRLLGLVPPYLLGVTLDAFFAGDGTLALPLLPAAWVPPSTRGQFALVGGLFVATAVLTAATHLVQYLSFRWFQGSVLHAVRTDAYAAVERLGVGYVEREETGEVMSVLNNDVNRLREVLFDWLERAVELTTLLVGLCLAMVSIHAQLTLLTLSFLPVMLAAVYAYQRAVEPRYDARRAAVGAVNAHVQNAVAGVAAVKTFAAEDREAARLRRRSLEFWRADWAAAKLSGLFGPTRSLLAEVASLTVVVVGGWWALFGPPGPFTAPLTTGTFVTFLFYGRWLVDRSADLGALVDTYTDGKASAKRVFALVDAPPTLPEPDDPVPLASVEGRVTYEGVTFSYPDAVTPTLRDVRVDVDPGEFVGLVGPTGAGKSTLLKLLARFHDPDAGTVRLDGVDVSQLRLDRLREAVGYVRQDPFLFDRTVRENIAYGAPDATDAEIRTAAKRANAHAFVRDLPEGYDTTVGERGVKLSGGQRQRLAIARAMLADPDVLLLDEATSHVDARTERLVREGLAALVAGRTTVAVAHRLSTVRDADRILVVDDGEVVERGTHAELLAEGGLYADLWRLQSGEQPASALPGD